MPADEFEIIRTLFAPLAVSAGARGLIDDVAVLEARGQVIVTTDAIVEGVHFLPDDPIDLVAKKALRVNLSDLAAKGARPHSALLTLVWPDQRPASQIGEFARGLGEDLRHFGVALIGGDTTSTPGPLAVCMTLFGEAIGERIPSRADARPGQDIWVTGTLGDAWLGFEVLRGAWPEAEAAQREAVVARYRLPEPRIAFAPAVAAYAGAAMDVSDGLIADAGKLAKASRVVLRIDADSLPLSPAARAWMSGERVPTYGRFFNWGDDYEILFTSDAVHREAIAAAGSEFGMPVKRVGEVAQGEGVNLNGVDDASFGQGGHSHKLGR